MSSTLHVPAVWLVMGVVTAVFVIVYPFVLGMIARKKLAVGWKYFWFGVLVFLVFQLLTRLPLLLVLQNTVLAPLLRTSTTFTWIWAIIGVVTAGLFEEVGRYVGYRLFMRREPKTWSKAVMFGLGHEGLESIVLVGGQIVLTLLSIAILSAINVNSLPVAQRQTILQQIAAINAQPFGYLLLQAAWGRFWSFPLQVALSVMVLQVFRRRQIRWLFLAILFHTLIDFLTTVLPQMFLSTTIQLLANGLLCAFGLIGVWIIWRLREPGDHVRAGEEVAGL